MKKTLSSWSGQTVLNLQAPQWRIYLLNLAHITLSLAHPFPKSLRLMQNPVQVMEDTLISDLSTGRKPASQPKLKSFPGAKEIKMYVNKHLLYMLKETYYQLSFFSHTNNK